MKATTAFWKKCMKTMVNCRCIAAAGHVMLETLSPV